jgi:hypothetical protein
MFAKRVLPLYLILVLSVVFAGCAPTIVGTNMCVYTGTKLYSVSDKDVGAVYNATVQAMEKLQLDITRRAKDVFSAKVVAQSADGKTIVVEIKPIDNNKAEYTIKVGPLGNEARSQVIYTEIRDILTQE